MINLKRDRAANAGRHGVRLASPSSAGGKLTKLELRAMKIEPTIPFEGL